MGLVGISTTGFIYPYFFCYSCPWDIAACPLGILEHGFIDIQVSSLFFPAIGMLLFLGGFMILIGILFGRAFCGWACPMGALQDLSRKFKISAKTKKSLKPVIDPRFKYTKFLILGLIPVTSYLSQD